MMRIGYFPGGGFTLLLMLVFLLALGIIVAGLVRSIGQWNRNNHAPRLTVSATVVAKRGDVRRHHHSGAGGAGHTASSTTYYVTFQVASGDRMELQLDGREYGLLAEGDQGELTFQGTRYLGFQRM